jgi:predicted DNA-binding transcriptional regulator YafY
MITACEDTLDIRPISKRTIEGDIFVMRKDPLLDFKAPIVYNHSYRAYIYSDPDYSIDKFPVNADEVQTLRFAATILKQFKHIDYLSQFEGTVQKIVNAIDNGGLSGDGPDMSFVQFEKSPLIRGTEYLQELIDYISDKKVIRIKYRKFDSDKAADYVLHPYLLKEYRNRWYVVGYHEEGRIFKIFGLERIEEITPLVMKTYLTKVVDFDRFFCNSIGITRYDEKPEDIQIAFSPRQSRYLATQPLHPSQALVKEENGWFIFKFHLVPTPEFIATLLGWAEEIEVLKPAKFRREFSAKIEKMMLLYRAKLAAAG